MPAICASLLAMLVVSASPDPPPDFEPTSNYTVQTIHGWRVYVNNRLLNDQRHQATGQRALALLESKLADVQTFLPKDKLQKVKEIPIWIEADNDKFNPCACYHVDEDWLQANGFNPEKTKAVEISNAARFLDWIKTQPMMVMHELAHGYHDRVLTYENRPIIDAFQKAKDAGIYDAVRRFQDDGPIVRHYALNTPMEYFAEATEAYFGRNDYFPFVREELARHDPAGHELMVELWGEPAGGE